MRRAFFAAVLLFLSSTAFAGETRRYLVATESPAGDREIRALVRDADGGTVSGGRAARPFRSVNGFAASLTEEGVTRLRRTPGVLYVEPVVERHAYALPPTGQVVPYGIDAIRSREVWAAGKGAGTNVVVIDTGIDSNHPELKGIWAGGFNTFSGKTDPVDDNGHGTHVAGTIAAADNDIGVVGVAPQVRLWAIKVLDAGGSGSTEQLIQAVDWVREKKKELGGNWVLNLSLGSEDASALERAAFRRATDDGIVVAAASGNESEPTQAAPVSYPAAYPGVIAVGAVSQTKKIASFSNQGPEVAVVAPGVGILSTVPVGTGALVYAKYGEELIDGAAIIGAPKGIITGEFVYCGLGRPQDFPAAVNGKIALIRRGDLPFYEKTSNAKKAGATAVIIFNHDDLQAMTNWTLVPDSLPTELANFQWPVAIAISRFDGERLAQRTGTVTAANDLYDYRSLNGTSMATPHVAGALALIWSLAPTATATDVTNALVNTAIDLGETGRDSVYGAGLIDAAAAAKRLAPNGGSSPAKPVESGPTTGRPAGMGRRG